jgi:glycosyltransferase domain-containing protein
MKEDLITENKNFANDCLLSKLTIIIMSINRHRYLLRNLHYWSGKNVNVFALDGSTEPIKNKFLTKLSPTIHYLHIPEGISSRLYKATQLTTTEYTMLLGDDEFYIPSGLERCIKELEKEPSLSCCMGRCLQFTPRKQGLMGREAYQEMIDYSLLQNDPEERAIAHMGNYTSSTIYSVARTNIWKQAMSTFTNAKLPADYELLFEICVSFLGKSKVIPEMTWLRSGENVTIHNRKKDLTFMKWWEQNRQKSTGADFLEYAATCLAKNNSDMAKTRDGFEKGLDTYLFTKYIPKISLERRLLEVVALLIPKYVKSLLKHTFGNYHNRVLGLKPFKEAARGLASSGVKVDMQELQNIEQIILEFHNIKKWEL